MPGNIRRTSQRRPPLSQKVNRVRTWDRRRSSCPSFAENIDCAASLWGIVVRGATAYAPSLPQLPKRSGRDCWRGVSWELGGAGKSLRIGWGPRLSKLSCCSGRSYARFFLTRWLIFSYLRPPNVRHLRNASASVARIVRVDRYSKLPSTNTSLFC